MEDLSSKTRPTDPKTRELMRERQINVPRDMTPPRPAPEPKPEGGGRTPMDIVRDLKRNPPGNPFVGEND